MVFVDRCVMGIMTAIKEKMNLDAANRHVTASVAIQLLQHQDLLPLQYRDAFSSRGSAMATTTAATIRTNSTAVNTTSVAFPFLAFASNSCKKREN